MDGESPNSLDPRVDPAPGKNANSAATLESDIGDGLYFCCAAAFSIQRFPPVLSVSA